jgi:isopentenyl-diphosphate delta-isomerase
MVEAVARRAQRELGITLDSVTMAVPDFRYRAVDASGVVENEICPVFIAVTSDTPRPADDEVAEFEWVDARALLESLEKSPWAFSPWLTLQLPALEAAGLLGANEE